MTHFKTLLLTSAVALFSTTAMAADAAPAGKPLKPNRWLAKHDANHDGKLSKQEFMAAHESYFNEADTNRDGSLDSAEMKAHADKKRAERAARGKKQPAPR